MTRDGEMIAGFTCWLDYHRDDDDFIGDVARAYSYSRGGTPDFTRDDVKRAYDVFVDWYAGDNFLMTLKEAYQLGRWTEETDKWRRLHNTVGLFMVSPPDDTRQLVLF